jgi:hypothetical protein
MTSKEELVSLNDWMAMFSQDGKIIDTGAVEDFDQIEAGASVATEGDIPQSAALFIYVLQPGPQDSIAVLYRPSTAFAAGAHVRIPDQGWLTTAITGPLAVVGCTHEVNADEWPGLLGGHDGDMNNGSTKKSATATLADE